STNPDVRGSDFIVWVGDSGQGFWVGVPQSTPQRVRDMLEVALQSVDGYEMSYKSPHLSFELVPGYRYEKGEVIEYLDELAGTTRVDGDEYYGSGLTIHYRARVPEGAIELLAERLLERGGTRSPD